MLILIATHTMSTFESSSASFAHQKDGSALEVEHRKAELAAGTVDAEDAGLVALGYRPELTRNRTLSTVLFQSIAISELAAHHAIVIDSR